MSNSLVTVKEVARQALPRLIENLVFPSLIYRDYSNDFQAGKGNVIQIRKPVVLSAADFDAESGVTPSPVSESTVDVALDKLATVDVEFGALESATDIDDLNRLFIGPAAAALAEKINSDGLALFADITNCTGTAGTTPDGLDDFAGAAKVLNENKAPAADRSGVWSPAANAMFQQIPSLVNAEKSGSTKALRSGAIGRVFGLDNYMAQGVKSYTSAGLAAGGTGVSGMKVSTAVTASLTVTAVSNATASGTLTGSLKKGDIVTIGTARRVLTADAAAADNAVTLTLNAPVTASAGDAVAVVAKGGEQNLVFHKNAFAFVTRPLSAPAGVESYTTNYNGICLRVCRGYDMKYKKDMLSMDVLYGYKTLYPELAVRVLG